MEKYFPKGEFPKGITQLEIEMRAFSRGGTEDLGGANKEHHAHQVISMGYPWVYKNMNEWLEMIIWAWCNYEEVAGAGCMASGKSWGFSLMSWLEWSTASLLSACVLSSTTKAALKTRVWTHIRKFRDGLIVNGQRATFPCHIIPSQTIIQAEKGDDMHSISCVAVQGGQLEQSIGNIQGRHPQRMIVMCDEGEQTPEAIFSARFNLRGGTSFFRFVSMANAVNPASPFGLFIEPKAGWNTVTKRDTYWETKTGVCLHFHGEDSPNVKAGKVVVPGLITREDIEAIRTAKGEDSMEYAMYVEGFPAMGGVRNTVLSWSHILSHKAMDKTIWQGETKWLAALDPAFTSGGDDCTLKFARVGSRADGTITLHLEPAIVIQLTVSTDIPIDYQIADRVKAECTERGLRPEDFAMDATAASGLASIIEQRWGKGIRRVNFGSSATDRKMPGDDKTAKERCRNRVAELWMSFAALVRNGVVRGLSSKSAEQFCMRIYRLEGEKYALESKSDMKTRTGGKSPDEADTDSLLADLFRSLHGTGDVSTGGVSEADAWAKKARQYQLEDSYSG